MQDGDDEGYVQVLLLLLNENDGCLGSRLELSARQVAVCRRSEVCSLSELGRALQNNTRLSALCVEAEAPDASAVAVMLGEALRRNSSLTSLSVHVLASRAAADGSGIGDVGAAALADALAVNRRLEYLSIDEDCRRSGGSIGPALRARLCSLFSHGCGTRSSPFFRPPPAAEQLQQADELVQQGRDLESQGAALAASDPALALLAFDESASRYRAAVSLLRQAIFFEPVGERQASMQHTVDALQAGIAVLDAQASHHRDRLLAAASAYNQPSFSHSVSSPSISTSQSFQPSIFTRQSFSQSTSQSVSQSSSPLISTSQSMSQSSSPLISSRQTTSQSSSLLCDQLKPVAATSEAIKSGTVAGGAPDANLSPSRLWNMVKTGAQLVKAAYQAKRVENERKSQGICLFCHLLSAVAPVSVVDARLQLAARTSPLQKLCSMVGQRDDIVAAIEEHQQTVLELARVGEHHELVYHSQEASSPPPPPPASPATTPAPAPPLLPVAWFACLSSDGQTLTVCFRGTRKGSLSDWLANAEATPSMLGDSGVGLHCGLHALVSAWAPHIIAVLCKAQAKRVVLSGHSKGGGCALVLAVLLALRRDELQARGVAFESVTVLTYGSPLVVYVGPGTSLANAYSLLASWFRPHAVVVNVVNENDPVPRILGRPVQQVADEVLLSPLSETSSHSAERDIARYIPFGDYFFIKQGGHSLADQADAYCLSATSTDYLPLLTELLDLPLAFSDGLKWAKQCHKMGSYRIRLEHICSAPPAPPPRASLPIDLHY